MPVPNEGRRVAGAAGSGGGGSSREQPGTLWISFVRGRRLNTVSAWLWLMLFSNITVVGEQLMRETDVYKFKLGCYVAFELLPSLEDESMFLS